MARDVIAEGISPSEIVARLAAKGVVISERSLRRRARELGACLLFGKSMLLLPEHIEMILAPPAPRNPAATVAARAGSRTSPPDVAYRNLLRRLEKKPPAAAAQRPRKSSQKSPSTYAPMPLVRKKPKPQLP